MLSNGKEDRSTALAKRFMREVISGYRNNTVINKGNGRKRDSKKMRLPGIAAFLYALW